LVCNGVCVGLRLDIGQVGEALDQDDQDDQDDDYDDYDDDVGEDDEDDEDDEDNEDDEDDGRSTGSSSLYNSSARVWYFFGHSMYRCIASLSSSSPSGTCGMLRTAIMFHIREMRQPDGFHPGNRLVTGNRLVKKGTSNLPCALMFGWNTRESKYTLGACHG
jgi:hypothetical protein